MLVLILNHTMIASLCAHVARRRLNQLSVAVHLLACRPILQELRLDLRGFDKLSSVFHRYPVQLAQSQLARKNFKVQ